MPTKLIVLTFDSPTGADAMLETLEDLQDNDLIELLNAVIVTKDVKDNVQVRQPLEVGPGKGAAFGALTGAVIGMLGGPGGAIVGLVSGAVTGSATGAALEAGVPKEDIEALAVDELEPYESALLVYLDDFWVDQLEQTAKALDATITHQIVVEQHEITREEAAEVRKEKVDAAYKSWQANIDEARASVTALRQQIDSDMQADRAAIQKQIDSAKTQLDTLSKRVLQTLRAWQQQIDAHITELETQAKNANAEAKADIQRRLASAQEAGLSVRTHVKDTLSARLNGLKSDIDNLKAQADKASGEAKDKLNQRVAKLQAGWEAEQKRLKELDKAQGEAWDKMAKSIDEAVTTYDSEIDEAEAEFKKKA